MNIYLGKYLSVFEHLSYTESFFGNVLLNILVDIEDKKPLPIFFNWTINVVLFSVVC